MVDRELESTTLLISFLFIYLLFQFSFVTKIITEDNDWGYITFPPARVLACKSLFSNRRFIVFILAISDQGSLNDDLKTGEWP